MKNVTQFRIKDPLFVPGNSEQNVENKKCIGVRNVVSILMLILLFSIIKTTNAAVVYQDVGFITNSYLSSANFFQAAHQNEPMAVVDRLEFTQAGTYELMLTDFVFPTPLSELYAGVTDGSESYFLQGPGKLFFEVTSPDTYFLTLGGTPGLDNNIGLYGVQIQTVPIPPAVLLLGSGFLMLFGLNRRLKKQSN